MTRHNGIDPSARRPGDSVLGLPLLSIPCGRADGSLPVSVQVVGPLRGERAILRAGRALDALWALELRPPAPFGG